MQERLAEPKVALHASHKPIADARLPARFRIAHGGVVRWSRKHATAIFDLLLLHVQAQISPDRYGCFRLIQRIEVQTGRASVQ